MTNAKQLVVVVDDDAGMSQAIERLLNAAGFQAVTFPSAEALLESNSIVRAACLVLDVHLPGQSGFELYHQLIEKNTRLPVVFITAYDDPDSRIQAKQVGAIGYLTKPFRGETLLSAIVSVFGCEPVPGPGSP